MVTEKEVIARFARQVKQEHGVVGHNDVTVDMIRTARGHRKADEALFPRLFQNIGPIFRIDILMAACGFWGIPLSAGRTSPVRQVGAYTIPFEAFFPFNFLIDFFWILDLIFEAFWLQKSIFS